MFVFSVSCSGRGARYSVSLEKGLAGSSSKGRLDDFMGFGTMDCSFLELLLAQIVHFGLEFCKPFPY